MCVYGEGKPTGGPAGRPSAGQRAGLWPAGRLNLRYPPWAQAGAPTYRGKKFQERRSHFFLIPRAWPLNLHYLDFAAACCLLDYH